MAQYQRLQQFTLSGVRGSSRDSGHGTEPNTASLDGHSRSPSEQSEGPHFHLHSQPDSPDDDDDEAEDVQEKRGFLRNTKVDRFLSAHIPRFAAGRTLKAMQICSAVLDRFMPMLGFIAISTGAVTWGGIAHGDSVFNILAHFIKGGIFFWYGLLTLGRWMGCWADLGWAWNIKPGKELVGRARAWAPSAEFTESFVICLYGASNVWLEHLAASQQEWDAMDLEHVSISILFFGGGLLGMLVESSWVRDMLSTSITYAGATADAALAAQQQGDWEKPEQYRFPMNPIPALVILLLGVMMGQHHQAAMLSTKIHAQWGNLFAGFSMARAVTYITLYVSPPKSYLPSRPPSELVSAWCLIAGGITFIVSNKDTVSAMELYNLDAMFSFTVTMGLTGFIFAWEVVCLALRGWAVRRENKALFQSQTIAA